MTSVRSWTELVDEGRQLKIMEERIEAEHGNIRWQWGDLALEVAPATHKTGPSGGADERLRRFAQEIDVSFESLRQYRTVADKWPFGMRVPNQPWVCHQQIMAKDDREELISNPVDVRTGEAMERWTYRAMQRFLGQVESPVYKKSPRSLTEKAVAIKELLDSIPDSDVLTTDVSEFIDEIVEAVAILDERIPRPPRPELTLSERWEKAIGQLDRVLTMLARLNNETDDTGIHLSGHAAAARYLYERIAEKKLEAEIRQFLDAEVG